MPITKCSNGHIVRCEIPDPRRAFDEGPNSAEVQRAEAWLRKLDGETCSECKQLRVRMTPRYIRKHEESIRRAWMPGTWMPE